MKQLELIFGTMKEHIYPDMFELNENDHDQFYETVIAVRNDKGQSYILDLGILKIDPTNVDQSFKLFERCDIMEK